MSDVIGVVGLGVMGSAMAHHIAAGGFELCGFDTDNDKVEAFTGKGLNSTAEVAQASDVLLVSLPSPEALAAVAAEIATVGKRGLVVVEMGTFSLSDKFAARDLLLEVGVETLDAPVSGTGLQAADGTLVVYCSGPQAAYERVEPVFDLLGKQSYDLGEFGNGSRMKFIANLLVSVHTLATAEAHAMGAAAGLDAELVQRVIGAGVGTSKMFDIRGPMVAANEYEPPSARLAIISKDAHIIEEFARDTGAITPLLDAAIPMYEQGVAAGLGDLDAVALRRLLNPRER